MIIRNRAFLTFLFFLFTCCVSGQVLKGVVLDDDTGEPVPYSTIFLNNTTFGVSADVEGNFSLKIPKGNYEVVVRNLGYELVVINIRTEELKPFYEIRLISDTRQLSEIKVDGERDALWYRNLEIFKALFLGTSENGRKCKILNPEVLVLDSESKAGTLSAKAMDVLKISNPKLGYEIDYILICFKIDSISNEVYFQGYPSYKNFAKYESKLPRRIIKSREQAYRGSIHHFLKSIFYDKDEEEGYLIRQVKRVPNPERPSDELIIDAKRKFSQASNSVEKDSLYQNYISREHLPEIISVGDTTFSNGSVFTMKNQDDKLMLRFEDYLEVTYTEEKMQLAYYGLTSAFYPKAQTSLLKMTVPYTIINHQGLTENPFDIFLQGYMGWEKMGDALPLDYNMD
ncbi:carboxypeptidase-like regulatory domain-containing protein [Pararhodonellum marinum]|uniref:carboxypeptidase-like regulatory domain-containing protein n=1 Tax=Pararhodonellum marinum TaxID=2755358 RepID=UPI00188E03AC|nr:carboxypeptidase-like regulatory domain-containing protein [Pararhodonellum marinum]